MFCPECGIQIEDDSKFCDGCGKPTDGSERPADDVQSAGSQQAPGVQQTADLQPQTSATMASQSLAPDAAAANKNRKPLLVIGAVIVIALLGWGGWTTFNKDDPGEVLKKYMHALETKDCGELFSLASSENLKEEGEDGIRKCQEEMVDLDITVKQLDIRSVEIEGNEATVNFFWIASMDGEEISEEESQRLVKENGSWKID